MEQEFQQQFILTLNIKKSQFKSAFKEGSEIYKLLFNCKFDAFQGMKLSLQNNEQIDDIDFDKIIFLFQCQHIKKDSMKQIVFDGGKSNFLSPKTIYKILNAYTQNIQQLHISIKEKCDNQLDDWIKIFQNIILECTQLQQIFIEVDKLFILSYNNEALYIKIQNGVLNNQECLQNFANITSYLKISKLTLKILDDNVVRTGLNYFTQYLSQINLTQVYLKIGQQCELKEESSLEFFKSLQSSQLKSLKIKIGSTNELSGIIIPLILDKIENGLQILKFDIGNSTKLFKQQQLFKNVKFNQLEQLIFRVGSFNSFQQGGANLISNLIDSKNLQIVKIIIGNFNSMTNMQSLQIFCLLQKLRYVKELQLSFDRDVCINNLCIKKLEEFIQANINLNNLSLTFFKQQEQLNFQTLFKQLGNKTSLIQLDLSFGGSQYVQNLVKFGQLLNQLPYLTAFKINFKGNNNINYQELKQCLQIVKSNKAIKLMKVINGQQWNSEQSSEELIENSQIIQGVCLYGEPIFMNFNFLHSQIRYEYNFDRLFVEGQYPILNLFKYFPQVSNQLIIKVNNATSRYIQFSHLKQMMSNLQDIDIQVNELTYKLQKGKSILCTNHLLVLLSFIDDTDNYLTKVICQKSVEWLPISQYLIKLVQKFNSSNQNELEINFINIKIELKHQSLYIFIKSDFTNQPEEFQNLWLLIQQFTQYHITNLTIDSQISNFSQRWDYMSNAIQQLYHLQNLDLMLRNQTLDIGTCEDFRNYYYYLFKIFLFNEYLTTYCFQNEINVFPKELQLQIGNQMTEINEQIEQLTQQLLRIESGQNLIPEDQDVQPNQLRTNIQNLKNDIEARNNYIQQGNYYKNQAQTLLLKKQRLIIQAYIIEQKYSSRNYKQGVLQDMLELLSQ